jgi:hypothetical protein
MSLLIYMGVNKLSIIKYKLFQPTVLTVQFHGAKMENFRVYLEDDNCYIILTRLALSRYHIMIVFYHVFLVTFCSIFLLPLRPHTLTQIGWMPLDTKFRDTKFSKYFAIIQFLQNFSETSGESTEVP